MTPIEAADPTNSGNVNQPIGQQQFQVPGLLNVNAGLPGIAPTPAWQFPQMFQMPTAPVIPEGDYMARYFNLPQTFGYGANRFLLEGQANLPPVYTPPPVYLPPPPPPLPPVQTPIETPIETPIDSSLPDDPFIPSPTTPKIEPPPPPVPWEPGQEDGLTEQERKIIDTLQPVDRKNKLTEEETDTLDRLSEIDVLERERIAQAEKAAKEEADRIAEEEAIKAERENEAQMEAERLAREQAERQRLEEEERLSREEEIEDVTREDEQVREIERQADEEQNVAEIEQERALIEEEQPISLENDEEYESRQSIQDEIDKINREAELEAAAFDSIAYEYDTPFIGDNQPGIGGDIIKGYQGPGIEDIPGVYAEPMIGAETSGAYLPQAPVRSLPAEVAPAAVPEADVAYSYTPNYEAPAGDAYYGPTQSTYGGQIVGMGNEFVGPVEQIPGLLETAPAQQPATAGLLDAPITEEVAQAIMANPELLQALIGDELGKFGQLTSKAGTYISPEDDFYYMGEA